MTVPANYGAEYSLVYSLSHIYCVHHFLGYFKYYFTYDHFLFHCEIPMPKGVVSAKITLLFLLFSQISMLKFLHSLAVQICRAI